MEQGFVVGRCPKCMQELRVPEGLEQFSCMYCGSRLSQAELVTGDAAPAAADAGAYGAALEALAGCVRNYRGYQKRVTKTEFVPAFEEYEAGCSATVLQLDAGVSGLSDAERAEKLTAAAERLIDELEQDWSEKRRADRFLQENDKYVIALFFVPMVLHQNVPSGREFADTLQRVWVARYPKSPFYVGDYETLAGGFQKKKFFGLCFITTAVCESEGKADDCEELTAFRAFRDGYLRAQPDGAALIEEYYRIAPAIVMCIDICGDREARYAGIREKYLQPCYAALQANDLAGCKETYVRMVRALECEYLN